MFLIFFEGNAAKSWFKFTCFGASPWRIRFFWYNSGNLKKKIGLLDFDFFCLVKPVFVAETVLALRSKKNHAQLVSNYKESWAPLKTFDADAPSFCNPGLYKIQKERSPWWKKTWATYVPCAKRFSWDMVNNSRNWKHDHDPQEKDRQRSEKRTS